MISGAVKIWNANTSHCMFTQTFQNTLEQSEGKEDVPPQSAIVDVSYCETKNKINLITYDHNILLCDLEDLHVQKQVNAIHVHLYMCTQIFVYFSVLVFILTTQLQVKKPQTTGTNAGTYQLPKGAGYCPLGGFAD